MDAQTSKRINDLGTSFGELAYETFRLMDLLFWLKINVPGIRIKYQKMFMLLDPYHKYYEDLTNGTSRVQALVTFTTATWKKREEVVMFSNLIIKDALRNTDAEDTFKMRCKKNFLNSFLGIELENFYEETKRTIKTCLGYYNNLLMQMESDWPEVERFMMDYPKEMMLSLLDPANKLEKFAYEEILDQCIRSTKKIASRHKLYFNSSKKKILKNLNFENLHLDDFGKQYDFRKYYPIYQNLMKVRFKSNELFPVFHKEEEWTVPKDKEEVKQFLLDMEKSCISEKNEPAPALPDKMEEIVLIPVKE